MGNHAVVGPSAGVAKAQRSFNGPFKRWPRTADAVLAAVLLVVALVFADDPGPGDTFIVRPAGDLPIFAYLIAAVGSAALYWRRRKPLFAYGATLVASVVALQLGSPDVYFFIFAVYSLGRYVTDDRWSLAGVAAALAHAWMAALASGETTGDTVGGIFIVFLTWYVGRRIRVRRTYLTVLQEHAARLERDQAAEAQRAVAEERTRIARELHDVVAHRVSVMTVQAGAAKTVAGTDLDAAMTAMAAVEATGRQALNELRHLLGVLRPDADLEELTPQSGIDDVPRLVDELRSAGLDVDLTISGLPADVPAQVDLSAYRIMQEALTNLLKHAGPDPQVEVQLRLDGDVLHVEVADRGIGRTMLPGSGHGIAGMRERALLLGGTLKAEPRPGGGFRVVASLPMGEQRS